MRISDWSSDVCSSDLGTLRLGEAFRAVGGDEKQRAELHAGLFFSSAMRRHWQTISSRWFMSRWVNVTMPASGRERLSLRSVTSLSARIVSPMKTGLGMTSLSRSEEHTSELQSLMRISYAVFCLKKKK